MNATTSITRESFPPWFRGRNTLLVGPTGTGKTYSIRSAYEAGLEIFLVFTEPSMELFHDLPSSRVHWQYVPPATPDWETMVENAERINSLSFKALSGLGDINKQAYDQFLQLLRALSGFTCDRTGEYFGPVDTWGPERMLVLDSLSGLNIMAMDMVVGAKPVKSMADWGVAMDNEERIINKLCMSTACWFTMIAHAEREVDEVLGGNQLMVSALGRKLAPRIPRYFSDVIYTKRDGKNFKWSTAEINVDTKARTLPISDSLEPNFAQIIERSIELAKDYSEVTELTSAKLLESQ